MGHNDPDFNPFVTRGGPMHRIFQTRTSRSLLDRVRPCPLFMPQRANTIPYDETLSTRRSNHGGDYISSLPPAADFRNPINPFPDPSRMRRTVGRTVISPESGHSSQTEEPLPPLVSTDFIVQICHKQQ